MDCNVRNVSAFEAQAARSGLRYGIWNSAALFFHTLGSARVMSKRALLSLRFCVSRQDSKRCIPSILGMIRTTGMSRNNGENPNRIYI
jgi:hypothetical protein